MRSSKPPMPPLDLAARLAAHNRQLATALEATVQTQAMRREHAGEREGLIRATRGVREWRLEAMAKRGLKVEGADAD